MVACAFSYDFFLILNTFNSLPQHFVNILKFYIAKLARAGEFLLNWRILIASLSGPNFAIRTAKMEHSQN